MSEKNKTDVTGTTSLSSTRQLLDELDQLMDRMLSLPVGESAPAEQQKTDGAISVAEMAPPDSTETGKSEAKTDEPLNLDDNRDTAGKAESATNYFFDEPETASATAVGAGPTESETRADDDWLSDEEEKETGDPSFGPQPISSELFSYLQESKKANKTELQLKSTGVFTPPAGRKLAWWLQPNEKSFGHNG